MSEIPSNVLQELRILRMSLESVESYPWESFDRWIKQASPYVRKWFGDDFAEFKEITKVPKFAKTPIFLGNNADENERKHAAAELETIESNRRMCAHVHSNLCGLLDGLLGAHSIPSSDVAKRETSEIDKRKVFVVYGRNIAARDAMFQFLRSIKLDPLEWGEIVQLTGQASPYVGDVLEAGFANVQAVVVLLTPDDEARLLPAHHSAVEQAYETNLTPQPRPNVILEAGMALGKFSDRTILVEFGTLRPISDILGCHMLRMNNSSQRRQDLAERLRIAGCDVQTSGTDWHNVGDFETCVKNVEITTLPSPANTFSAHLDGLSDTELFRLAKCVQDKTSTVLTGTRDSLADVLVHKGFFERVPFEIKSRTDSVPYLIPPHVWAYLNANKDWLIRAAVERNMNHTARLKALGHDFLT